MLRRWRWCRGRDQHVDLAQYLQKLLAQEDTRLEGAIIDLGRHQRGGLQSRARGTIELSSTGPEDVVPRPGSFGISYDDENCPAERHQWDRDLEHLSPLLPQHLYGVVDGLFDFWMHASILVQFTDQADAYTAQITTETGRVIRHRAATRKRVARVVSSNGTEEQGAVLHRFGHGSRGVQIPAHGGHAIATHASEGRA